MISANGISTNSGINITWDEIVSISSHKIDAMTKVLTYLVFDHECGEYLEFTNEDSEFQSIIDALDDYLSLPNGWKKAIKEATPDDGIIELWTKKKG